MINMSYVLVMDKNNCIYCMDCVKACSSGALSFTNVFWFNDSECINCKACSESCERDCIEVNNNLDDDYDY